MLALTRKPEESILIGGNIEIMVLECRAGRCKVGIKAPLDVEIIRKELVTEQQTINMGKWKRESVRPAA